MTDQFSISSSSSTLRRWYDQDIAVARLLQQLRLIQQPEVIEFCARMLSHFAEQARHQIQTKNEQGVTSIGLQGIQTLYKFKQQQRRWYDEERYKIVQNAVGTLYTLPPEGLTALGLTIGDAVGMIYVYAQVCFDTNQPPLTHDLIRISTKALHEGWEPAAEVLKEILGSEYFASLSANLQESKRMASPEAAREPEAGATVLNPLPADRSIVIKSDNETDWDEAKLKLSDIKPSGLKSD